MRSIVGIADEEGDVFLLVGTAPGELATAVAAIALARAYAVVDDGREANLKVDMEVTRGRVDGAFHASMKRQMCGSIH